MRQFFYPRSVAVVGVSQEPDNLGQGIVANLLEFEYQGKIFLVGRKPGAAMGLPIFPGLSHLPQPVDLAVILAPARVIPGLVQECGELGITRVVVESAGFSELNQAGRDLEEEVRALVRHYGLRLVGPNGLGVMNLEIGLALPFAQIRPRPRRGAISIVAQSGGVATHLLAWMTREGLGLNKFLSLGNKLDVSENEALAYLLDDPGTAAIYLYLEGMENGRELMAAAHGARKPIFLHLCNVGPETAAIARSHTASLATDERVLSAACRQWGIVHLETQAQFLSAAKLVGQPPVRGNRLVVLSRSGGEAVVAAYACRRWGFTLPPLADHLVNFIRERSRAGVIHPTNPIDLGDVFDFTVYSEIMAQVCGDPQVDAVLFHYGPLAEFELPAGREMARHLLELAQRARKPMAVVVLCTLEEEEFVRESLGVPVFHFPEEAIQALALSRYLGDRIETGASEKETPCSFAPELITGLLAGEPPGFLPLPLALALVEAMGIPTAPWEIAVDAKAAVAAAQRLGYPVVLKLSAPGLVHKTEAGAVLLGLTKPGEVEAGFARLAELAHRSLPGELWQVLVMSQVSGGREVLLGARRDPSFGPVLVFGAGGVDTEVLDDISLKLAPLSLSLARQMVTETRVGRILAGIRGLPPADLDALVRRLVALSQLMLKFPAIQEVDLNPVRLFPGQTGLVALDARLRLATGG